MKVIVQQIYQGQTNQTKQDLNSILNRWKWGNQPLKTSAEFLRHMAPWISERIKEEKELKEFLTKEGITSLGQISSITKTGN